MSIIAGKLHHPQKRGDGREPPSPLTSLRAVATFFTCKCKDLKVRGKSFAKKGWTLLYFGGLGGDIVRELP